MPLTVLSLLTHAFIAWRLVPALADSPGWQVAVATLIALSVICLQIGLSRWRKRRRQRDQGDAATVAAFVALGFLSSLFVLTLLRDVALVVAWIGDSVGLPLPLSALAHWSALAVPTIATLMTAWGLIN